MYRYRDQYTGPVYRHRPVYRFTNTGTSLHDLFILFAMVSVGFILVSVGGGFVLIYSASICQGFCAS